ncbi:MAG: alpha/beta hydrolase family protein [Planctomycetota bacterium]|jgi:hypothetical protein
MLRTRLLAVLLAAAALASAAGGGRGGEAAGEKPPERKEAGPSASLPALKRMFKGLVVEDPPPGAAFRPRHPVDRRLRLRYAGHVRERVITVSSRGSGVLTDKLYEMNRVNLVAPAGDGLARTWLYSRYRLIEAGEAGRDRLALLRSRPSRGVKVAALMRRLSARGLEPAGADLSVEHLLAPVPELPRLPAGEVVAGKPASHMAGGYLVTWALVGSGKLDGRACWLLARGVRPAEILPRTAGGAIGVSVYLLDAKDSSVLGVVSQWKVPVPRAGTVRERLQEFRLTKSENLDAKALEKEAARVEAARRLLAAVNERSVAGTERAVREAERITYEGPALALARRFAAAERQLASTEGGARRVDLVPEDTFVHLWAPPGVKPDTVLTPVIFFHGAAAEAATYFEDWASKAGDRRLLLIFPQSRDWTWSGRDDGEVAGSLLDALGRSYRLDAGRLVLAGHAAGGEMAFVLGYGASFPKRRVRGIVAAGALLDKRIRDRAFTEKPPELLARLRSTDVFLLSGKQDKHVRPDSVSNLYGWLRTYNPEGIRMEVDPEAARQYDADWTPKILDWIARLRPKPAGEKRRR